MVVAGCLAACSGGEQGKEPAAVPENYALLKKADWLLGKWKSRSPEGEATEIWAIGNDSTYTGKSYFIAGKDTVSSESLVLMQAGGDLLYIPTVKNQNEGKPVSFTLTSYKDNTMIFENPKHDFPQKIRYTRITNDSLLAEISGVIEGKENAQQFPMKREQ